MSATRAVRPLRQGDRPAWDRLWQGYLTFYGEDLPAEITEQTWTRILDPQFELHGICVTDGERIVGICHYHFHVSTWSAGPYCYLEDLYVDEELRGGGYGRALIEAVYAAADERAAARVYWVTQTDNATARRLYDRIATLRNFVQYSRKLGSANL